MRKNVKDIFSGRTKMNITQWQSWQKKIKGKELTPSTRKRKQKRRTETENSGHKKGEQQSIQNTTIVHYIVMNEMEIQISSVSD